MSFQNNTISSLMENVKDSVFLDYSFISLGANLNSKQGSPKDTIMCAIDLLKNLTEKSLLISSLLTTKPLDCPPGSPTFVNAVIGLVPSAEETPLTLLVRLQEIENNLGRKRTGVVNEARVLDLDLITFKKEIHTSNELTVPHPRAIKRKFVLIPLRELTGNKVFPGQSLWMDDLINLAE